MFNQIRNQFHLFTHHRARRIHPHGALPGVSWPMRVGNRNGKRPVSKQLVIIQNKSTKSSLSPKGLQHPLKACKLNIFPHDDSHKLPSLVDDKDLISELNTKEMCPIQVVCFLIQTTSIQTKPPWAACLNSKMTARSINNPTTVTDFLSVLSTCIHLTFIVFRMPLEHYTVIPCVCQLNKKSMCTLSLQKLISRFTILAPLP